ncbi:hypothetical protein SBF1_4820002 [Candidatus Desulfosporosinus infrequens]|uniref:Uncharacterized protein n=1 Tax=Candidatus Desulfosporosinus infrequens TaxID=2043169 RepID=A0A2U3LF54_9FIRM|nr:hypothetical protein SBF1_4820002 [Candidatus Desulfosporosinus infrequens]
MSGQKQQLLLTQYNPKNRKKKALGQNGQGLSLFTSDNHSDDDHKDSPIHMVGITPLEDNNYTPNV